MLHTKNTWPYSPYRNINFGMKILELHNLCNSNSIASDNQTWLENPSFSPSTSISHLSRWGLSGQHQAAMVMKLPTWDAPRHPLSRVAMAHLPTLLNLKSTIHSAPWKSTRNSTIPVLKSWISVYTCIDRYVDTYRHIYIHTYIHTYTYTSTHMQICRYVQ